MKVTFLLLILCVGLCWTRFVAEVPAAIWSPQEFSEQPLISDVLSLKEFEEVINSKISREINFIFVEPQMRSYHISLYKDSFPHLRKMMKEQFSLQIPSIDLQFSLRGSLINAAQKNINRQGKVIYAGSSSSVQQDLMTKFPQTISTSIANLKDVIAENALLLNKVPDLVIVYLDSKSSNLEYKYKESDNTINQVIQDLDSLTGDYTAIYTALQYDDPHYTTSFATSLSQKRFALEVLDILNSTSNTSSNSTIPVFRQYFGGWFWELFLVCMFVIPSLLIGVFSINNVQTPLFETKKKVTKAQ
eukprot:TRINITY_DN2676_c0_g1_i1.p1 TRINITY_DN2676_c0_g1~~TRINITY_DN2676_c0_g1_i1.p1  ORF type:complete len:303 (+),score=64.47 TRINITY_DN2676_c0_g1_i1:50-958(+)